MAVAGQKPVLANPLLAQAAFERDLVVVLKGRGVTWEESGWTRLNELALLIPLHGYLKGVADGPPFILKLDFHYYPDWPPSAQFVNPATNAYAYPTDSYWLPRLQSDEIQTHEKYPYDNRFIQLICSSITWEFYEVLHGVEERFVWKYPKQTFAATLNRIEGALTESYHGRFASNPS